LFQISVLFKFILNLIKGVQDNDEITNDDIDHSESDDTNIDLNDGDNEDNTSNAIGLFLENIKQKSMTNALVKGNRISAYFLPELLPHMIRFAHIFRYGKIFFVVFSSLLIKMVLLQLWRMILKN